MQKWGFEWLWRIKEEPHLWRRYWHDGTVLLRLLLTQVVPVHRSYEMASAHSDSKAKELPIERKRRSEFRHIKH